jgi:hypothetical protein
MDGINPKTFVTPETAFDDASWESCPRLRKPIVGRTLSAVLIVVPTVAVDTPAAICGISTPRNCEAAEDHRTVAIGDVILVNSSIAMGSVCVAIGAPRPMRVCKAEKAFGMTLVAAAVNSENCVAEIGTELRVKGTPITAGDDPWANCQNWCAKIGTGLPAEVTTGEKPSIDAIADRKAHKEVAETLALKANELDTGSSMGTSVANVSILGTLAVVISFTALVPRSKRRPPKSPFNTPALTARNPAKARPDMTASFATSRSVGLPCPASSLRSSFGFSSCDTFRGLMESAAGNESKSGTGIPISISSGVLS